MKHLALVMKSGVIAALILLLTPSFVNPEMPDSYDLMWEKLESYTQKGLPRSAMEQLEIIHSKAVSEKNQPQLLKAILFRFSLWQSFEEDHLIQSIDFAHQTLPLLESPAKEILHSIIAEIYWFFYQENRYLFLERSSSSMGAVKDMREWDVARLRDSIEMHYSLSLRSQTISDTIPTSRFALIINKIPENAWQQQPTLFGFLANRVLDYYTQRDAALQDAVSSQKLNDFKLWQASGNFAAMKLERIDAEHHRILDLLQKMIASNMRQKQTEVLINNELFRFNYLRNNFENTNKSDSLYLLALEALQERNSNHPASALVAAERAAFLASGQTQIITDTIAYAMALKICDQAMQSFPQSRGAAMCQITKSQILETSISLTIQRVELPDNPIPVRFEYRNVTQPAFRLIKIKSESLAKIMELTNQEERAAAMVRLQPLHEWEIKLPFEADYATHSTIIDLPPLSNGLYLLLAAGDDGFTTSGPSAFTSFQVSRLAFIQQKRDNKNLFFLLDRDSGKAVANAEIHVMTREYNYTSRNYSIVKRLQLKSNRDGSFEVGPNADLPRNQAFYVEAMTKRDTLYSDNYFDVYDRRPNTRVQTKTWFFTDRAIYRPGQTVYFKGIILEKDKSDADWQIIKKQSSTVRLLDVNRKEIASLALKTNSFGSLEGSFTIPEQVLTGTMVLSNESGTSQIQVEAYKRPTFEVVLESDSSQASLNDTIVLHGKAKAFAGFGLDSVEVRFRVERERRFPYWPWWRDLPPYGGVKTQISSGKVFTHSDGSFQIRFVALPDASGVDEEPLTYNFSVFADVVDRNGETRSSSLVVPIGSVSLLMQSNVHGLIPKDETHRFTLSLMNLQQKSTNASVTSRFFLLEESERLQRPVLLAATDRFYHSPTKLAQLFPLDQYDLSANVLDRPKRLVHESTNFVKGSIQVFPEVSSDWPEGAYLIEYIAADDQGREVKLLQQFNLFDKKSKKAPSKETAWFYLDKDTALPGDTVTLFVASAAKGSRVLVEISSGTDLRFSKWYNTANKKIAIPYIIGEKDRGQIQFQALLVRHNRLHQFSEMVEVPFTNKMLDITLETYRQRLSPGAEENWMVRINGSKKEKVAAELLAAMYDASLDQFIQHSWNFNTLNRKAFAPRWSYDNGFLIYNSSQLFPRPPFDGNIPPKHDIQLNWFGLNNLYFWRGNGHPMPMMAKTSLDHSHHANEIDLMRVVDAAAVEVPEEVQTVPEATAATPTLLRSDFRETAFFYPQLTTDSLGTVVLNFKLPDALTRWKLLLLAHSKDLKTGLNTYSFEASKDLMVVPNLARFYYEGDTAWLAAKVVNTSDKILNGIGQIAITDALTRLPVDILQGNVQRPFVNLKPGESRELKWKVIVKDASSLLAIQYRASAGAFTDSEEQLVPVLPLGIRQTEAIPMMVPAQSSRTFSINSLKKPQQKEKNHRLTLQFASHPVWYAIQALPYLNSPENPSVEQLFQRVYANGLSSFVAQSIPSAMRVIESWKLQGVSALQSNLEKNAGLKAVLLEETPWVMMAENETAQKRALTVLFDINRMQYERTTAIQKLREAQLPDGSWPWFPGMRGNRYTTQSIVLSMGRLLELMPELRQDPLLIEMLSKAIRFLSDETITDYQKLVKEKQLDQFQIGASQLNYLLSLTYYPEISALEDIHEAKSFYLEKLAAQWLKLDLAAQAKAAIILHRNNSADAASSVLASLKEKSLHNPALGTYWKQLSFGTALAIETQAMLIAAFNEVSNDTEMVDGIRQWLLVNKQTNRWPTARATAEAVFALIHTGTEWVENQRQAVISINGAPLDFAESEAGSAFVEQSWVAQEIHAGLSEISIENLNPALAWGAVFREYSVPLDAVREHQTSLRIKRELLVASGTSTAPVWIPVTAQNIQSGYKVKVRLVIETDRNMEFVQLRDRRAAAFEPESMLSGYKWTAGLGYYEAVGDVYSDFFFDFLPKGKHVFEYNLIAMQQGDFVHGHASIQSYYAPEFTANSKGIRVHVGSAD